MASDTRNIVITIKSLEQHELNHKKEEDEKFSSNLSKLLHPIKTVKAETIGQVALLNYVYDSAKQSVQQIVQGTKNRYLSLTEDYISENSMSLLKNMSQKSMTVVNHVTSAAMLGAKVGGPAGAAVGATIGLGTAGIQLAIDRINTTSSFYRSLNETNYNTQFSTTRASLVNNGRGTEN